MMRPALAGMSLLAVLTSSSLLFGGNGAISVSPSVVMLSGAVGQSTTQTLSFTNGTSQSLSFEMKALDATVRDGKRVYVEPGTQPGSIAASAVFSPMLFTVAPGETASIVVAITIPPAPSVRAIAVMCQGTTKLGSGPLRMTGSVGTLITFAIAGDTTSATASSLEVTPPTESSNFVAKHHVSNTGTDPMVATGMLAILDSGGALIGKQAIPGRRLLPGETADVRVEYGGEIASGNYRALVTYDLTDRTLTTSADFSVH